MKRTASASERRHLASVAAMGCIVCSESLGVSGTPAQVHHVRVRHGWGRSNHQATIPLCPTHHQSGLLGVHDMGRDEFTRMYGNSEIDLLTLVNSRMGIGQ